MKILSLPLLFVAVLALADVVCGVHSPVKNIQVTLRGKKFDVDEAVTAKDVLGKMQKSAGVGDGRLLFDGKQLALDDSLEEVGVKEGDSLQMVPGSSTASKKKKSSSAASAAAAKADSDETDAAAAAADFDLSTMWKDAMGGGGGEGGGGAQMPDMSESMDMMANMMQSPIFKEYMSDPEKLEASRQMILQNPMMKQMMAGMPGMKEILEDPVAWKEAMTAAAELYQNMDPDDLKKAILGNMPDPGSFPGFGGNAGGAGEGGAAGEGAAGLDELSEED